MASPRALPHRHLHLSARSWLKSGKKSDNAKHIIPKQRKSLIQLIYSNQIYYYMQRSRSTFDVRKVHDFTLSTCDWYIKRKCFKLCRESELPIRIFARLHCLGKQELRV
jgi:hypothetical protein